MEVTNRGLETFLRCFESDKPRAWARYLPWAELCYNTSFHSTIQMTPFKAVYGRDPPSLLKYENGSTSNAELETRLLERDAMIAVMREHIHKAQQVMRERVDGRRREVEFAVGDMVYLKMRPYRQRSTAKRMNEKLAARFYGPLEVWAWVGAVAYRLRLPADAKIHHTFHVSQLKPAQGNNLTPIALPPQLTMDGILEAEPEEIWGSRVNTNSGQEEVLIKWKGLPAHDCSWEWKSTIRGQFPAFDLEDKVNFKGGGNDTYETTHPPIIHLYKKRGKAQHA